MTLDDILDRTCLIGLSYFDTQAQLMHQAQYAGVVVNVDAEKGISVRLLTDSDERPTATIASDSDSRIFVIPPHLSAWYKAPAGSYKDANGKVLVENPNYLVTWEVHKTQDKKQGDHEWWEWVPSAAPKVN